MRLDLDPWAIFGCNIAKWPIFVHCCSFSTSNKITSKGCQSASKTCDFDAFWNSAYATGQCIHCKSVYCSSSVKVQLKNCWIRRSLASFAVATRACSGGWQYAVAPSAVGLSGWWSHGSTSSGSAWWSTVALLCSIIHAHMILQALAGATRSSLCRQCQRRFNTPMHRSTVHRVPQCASL